MGTLFRPGKPLLPSHRWMPIEYRGRSSSIVVSGQMARRPVGQTQGIDGTPEVSPSQGLDHELALGTLIGRGNPSGTAVPIKDPEAHLFGPTLFNDGAAGKLQACKHQPLDPSLSKNLVITLSPRVVTRPAPAPLRAHFPAAFTRPESLLERTPGGRPPIVLRNGTARCLLAVGDRVGFRGGCQRPGTRCIGFGRCVATVLPAASTRTSKVPS